MDYATVKEAARDLKQFALNGSPIWRCFVTFALIGLCACAMYGYLNYASADVMDQKISDAIEPIQDDIESIKKRQKQDAINDVTASILNAKRDQCAAAREGRNARAWTERLQQLTRDYYTLAGQPFDMPICEEV